MADAYTKESGTEVDAQRGRPQHVPGEHQHLPAGHARTTCSPGSPASGWRSSPRTGLITDLSDVWPIDGAQRLLQGGLDRAGRQAVLRAGRATTRGRSSTGSRSSTRTATRRRTTYDDFMALDATTMQGKGVTPFAFGDKDGWPAMGTFDILNMRINGFDFHMSLMAGEEAWDGDEVKQVFETWRDAAALPPGRPAGSHLAGGRAPRWARASAGCTCSAPSSSTRSRTRRRRPRLLHLPRARLEHRRRRPRRADRRLLRRRRRRRTRRAARRC